MRNLIFTILLFHSTFCDETLRNLVEGLQVGLFIYIGEISSSLAQPFVKLAWRCKKTIKYFVICKIITYPNQLQQCETKLVHTGFVQTSLIVLCLSRQSPFNLLFLKEQEAHNAPPKF